MATASLFPTRSEAGLELAKQIADVLAARGVKPRVFDRAVVDVTMQDVASACLIDNVVIFDATRESRTNNFDIAVPLVRLPHVALVSRNYLPVDCSGFWEDLYPSYTENAKTNESIFADLLRYLDRLLAAKEHVDRATVFHGRQKALEIRPESLRQLRGNRSTVFISSRSRHQGRSASGTPFYPRSVAVLAQGIAEGQFGEPRTATFLEAGLLVYENELLTEHRRWQVLEQISSGWIRDCEEFLLYGSRDHFNSWWTLGEFVSFLVLNKNGRLRIYDPERDVVTDVRRDEVPRLELRYVNHLVHRFMLQKQSMLTAHERQFRILRRVAKLGRRKLGAFLMRPLLRLAYRSAMQDRAVPDAVGFKEYAKWVTSDYYLETVVGRTLEQSFWDVPELLADEGVVGGALPPGAGEWPDVRRFFELDGFRRVSVSTNDSSNQVVTSDGHVYSLREDRPRFVTATWGPRDYSAGGDNLAVLPVVRFFSVSDAA